MADGNTRWLVVLTTLSSDKNHPIGSTRSIDRGRSSILENSNTFNIIGVDTGHDIIIHLNSIHDKEGILSRSIPTKCRLEVVKPMDEHLGGSSWSARVSGYHHPRYTACKCIHGIGRRSFSHFFSLYGLY